MRLAFLTAVVAALVVGGYLAFGREADTYNVKMRLANAQGLRVGSPVTVGGVQIGKVRLDATHEHVEVDLDIEPDQSPIGRDARASIVAQNVLGQKQVRLVLGDRRGNPAPEGYTIPRSQIDETTDLDQLLGVLDPDTRTRLAILINEAGGAFAGREMDFKTFLRDFGPAVSSGGDLLGELTRDNRALVNLLATSDRYVAALARERRRLTRMINLVGRTTETVAVRRRELRVTLHEAPPAMTATRAFLTELRHTTQPLAQTARLLEQTAPSLQTTLRRVEPFRESTVPTLNDLIALAPELEELSDDGTQPLDAFVPAARSVRNLVNREFPPVGATLDKSMDNLLATMHNWSRAIQFRDRASHVFRGEASFSPSFFAPIFDRLIGLGIVSTQGTEGAAGAQQAPGVGGVVDGVTDGVGDAVDGATDPLPDEVEDPVDDTVDEVEDVIDDVPLPLRQTPPGPSARRAAPADRPTDPAAVSQLLDYLLGD